MAGPPERAAALHVDRADVLILRLDAVYAEGGGVEAALHLQSAAVDLGAHDGGERRFGGDGAGVGERQEDLPAGALAAGLHGGAAAPHDRDVLAELFEHGLIPALEAFAGGREHHDGNHAPQDAEHRQHAAQLVRPQVVDGLCDRFSHWGLTPFWAGPELGFGFCNYSGRGQNGV